MSSIIPFQFESNQVRVVVDEHDMPWFNANDICDALGYVNPRKSLSDHVDEDDVTKRDTIDSLGRTQQVNHVNESGLYALIFGSAKPEAKVFKRWVTSEVLPAIRKTGGYQAPKVSPFPEEPKEEVGYCGWGVPLLDLWRMAMPDVPLEVNEYDMDPVYWWVQKAHPRIRKDGNLFYAPARPLPMSEHVRLRVKPAIAADIVARYRPTMLPYLRARMGGEGGKVIDEWMIRLGM